MGRKVRDNRLEDFERRLEVAKGVSRTLKVCLM